MRPLPSRAAVVHAGAADSVWPTSLFTSRILPRVDPGSRSAPALRTCQRVAWGRTTTTVTTANATSAAAASLASAARCVSGAAKEAGSAPSAAPATATMTATDPMARAASPRYTSHAAAEAAAYRQEDNKMHPSDLVTRAAASAERSGHADGCCACEPHSGAAAGDAYGASFHPSATPPSPSATSATRRARRDFSSIFHEEVTSMGQTHLAASAAAPGLAPLPVASVPPLPTSTGTAPTPAATGSEVLTPSPQERQQHREELMASVHPDDIPAGVSLEDYVAHLEAEEEMQRFLAQNTLHSIRRSMARDQAADAAAEKALMASSTMRTRLEPHSGYRGVQALLDYNKQWAAEVTRFNPRYFVELAKEQRPEYLWIGCSDSRVPANEVIGLHPGDVFVHRNIGNLFSLSDLNCLSALQFAVDCLKVRHIIVAGHYKCGGVTAAMCGDNLGLTDHWIMQVTDIKNKWWDRAMAEVAEEHRLSLLCELNVLEQLNHVVSCRVVQRRWRAQNASDRYHGRTEQSVHVSPQYAAAHLSKQAIRSNLPPKAAATEQELEVHGWVYSLDDGMLRPLLSLTRHSNVKQEMSNAFEALFIRYGQLN